MSVESASYISGLNVLWPLDSDSKSEGDNHLRLIKSALKTSFPNINGAVTVTDEELNALSGVASNVQTQINDLSATISAMTTRLNNLSATLTTLTQSISALNTLVQRPAYVSCGWTHNYQYVNSAASATIAMENAYYNSSDMFSTATGRVTALTGSRFIRLRCMLQCFVPSGNGGVRVSIVRGSSAIASNIVSATTGGSSLPIFDIHTPFISAVSGETFCVKIDNTTSLTAVVIPDTITTIFDAELIAY